MRLSTVVMCLPLLLAATGPPVASAEGPKSNFEACAVERDDRRRLACYDAEVARLSDSAPAAGARASDDSAEKVEEGSEEPDSLAAVVTRIDEKLYGERIVYLDNGQVWEETSRNHNLPLAVGDDITVKAAAFGSYKLIGPGGKRFSRARRIR